MADPQAPRRIGVAVSPQLPEAAALATHIVEHLRARGAQVFSGTLTDEGLRDTVVRGDADLLVVLGGDGTMLRAGHLCAPAAVPILGINLGRFGFLIEVDRESWQTALDQVLSGDYWLERRMMLRVELVRREQVIGGWDVLNECAVSRGEIVRPVRLIAEVDGRYVTTYVADGLIVATPTGSTAYALAAGGPILPPELRNILIVAVAPHLSVDRAVVLSEGSSVSIAVGGGPEAVLSVDGQPSISLMEDDRVDVRAADVTAQFVRFGDPGYFYRNLTAHMNENSLGLPR